MIMGSFSVGLGEGFTSIFLVFGFKWRVVREGVNDGKPNWFTFRTH